MLETERLFIRNFEMEDAHSCLKGWGEDKNLGKYILGYPMEEDQMISFVSALAENKNAWVIVEKVSQNCIGYITIDIPYMQLGIGEIGYVIGERYQHKGYAHEAINCILQEYLVTRDMYMIEAKYNVNNIASGNLLKKLGFQVDGELRDRRIDLVSGKRNNLVVCSITKEENMSANKGDKS
ncbi:MAG: GNAT family N-acetyltransferase [Roseburia sp.]|nr:GNAT family N-acetyltransferase [Roseburia sp.]